MDLTKIWAAATDRHENWVNRVENKAIAAGYTGGCTITRSEQQAEKALAALKSLSSSEQSQFIVYCNPDLPGVLLIAAKTREIRLVHRQKLGFNI